MASWQPPKYLLRPSGGLYYHRLALFYRHSLWQSFRQAITEWLSHWTPSSQRLLIIGASGGYALSPLFLQRYRQVQCLDPDPLSGAIFRRRFSQALPQTQILPWHYSPSLALTAPQAEGAWQKLLAQYPDCDILLANFLGQINLVAPEAEAWHQDLRQALENRSFASFHDLYSWASSPPAETSLPTSELRQPPEEWLRTYGPRHSSSSSPLEICDHGTASLFSDPVFAHLKPTYFWWPRTPSYLHLIEGVKQTC